MIYVRTCAYNAEKTLKRAIDSILQQTYQNFEYHILENGSSDGTGASVTMRNVINGSFPITIKSTEIFRKTLTFGIFPIVSRKVTIFAF